MILPITLQSRLQLPEPTASRCARSNPATAPRAVGPHPVPGRSMKLTSSPWVIPLRLLFLTAVAGSWRPMASDGGGAMLTAPVPPQPGKISTASGTTLTPRDIWQPDGLSLTASPIILILPPAPCTPIRGHLITAGWMHPEHGCPEHKHRLHKSSGLSGINGIYV